QWKLSPSTYSGDHGIGYTGPKEALTARSIDMGNTMGIDMGYSFQFTSGPFHGHVVERNVVLGASAEVCEVGFEGPAKHVAIVSLVRVQSDANLQSVSPIERMLTTLKQAETADSKPLINTNADEAEPIQSHGIDRIHRNGSLTVETPRMDTDEHR